MVYLKTSSGGLCQASSCHGVHGHFKRWSESGQLSCCTWILQAVVYIRPVVMVYVDTSSGGLGKVSCDGVHGYFKRCSM